MPFMQLAGSGILPFASWAIILRIWPNCLTSWLTAWTVVPEPAAIRLRREPSISVGLARSAGVIERMIASSRSSSRSSMFTWRSCFIALPIPGIIPSTFRSGPIVPHLAHLLEEVLERELLLADLALEVLGLLSASETSSAFSISEQHVAHAEDPRRHPLRVEALELVEPLAGRRVEDRLAGDRLDRERRAAAGVAVELGQQHAVEVDPLGEGLGDVDGVLAGHRVEHSRMSWGLVRLRIAGQLVHQLLVDVQAAGGVDDQHVDRRRRFAWPSAHSAISTGSRSVPCS